MSLSLQALRKLELSLLRELRELRCASMRSRELEDEGRCGEWKEEREM